MRSENQPQEKNKQPVKVRKIPLRQCLGCNEHKPKAELLRVVRTPEGETLLDFTGRKAGRGAYICKDVRCLKRVRKNHRLEKSLSCEISDEVYDRMEAELTAAGGNADE